MSTIGSEYMTPPTLNTLNAPTNTSTSAASTAEVAIGGNGFYTFVARTADCWIVFGLTGLAAASATNGFNMPIGVPFPWKIESQMQTHFRVIASAAGTLSWYKSGP